MLITAATIVADGAVHTPGWVDVEGSRIRGVGAGVPSRVSDQALGDRILTAGFVDMHCHGGGGHAYPTDRPEEALAAVRYHRRHGTTSTLASLVTADLETLEVWVRTLAELVAAGELSGVHLEGPWLSPHRAGAHFVGSLGSPDAHSVDRLINAGAGTIRMITLAPELPGGSDAVERIAGAGVIAAIGHTDADYRTTAAAIERGATVATHLFNAMRPLGHREPGPILALLDDDRVTLEMIPDGVHVHPATFDHVVRCAESRVAVVTDALPAAGMPDGCHELGPVAVTVSEGVARARETGAIAGSTATMDELFARVAGRWQRDLGLLARAAALTAATPARALGLLDVGRLAPGYLADLVVMDRDLGVQAVLRRGRWIHGGA